MTASPLCAHVRAYPQPVEAVEAQIRCWLCPTVLREGNPAKVLRGICPRCLARQRARQAAQRVQR